MQSILIFLAPHICTPCHANAFIYCQYSAAATYLTFTINYVSAFGTFPIRTILAFPQYQFTLPICLITFFTSSRLRNIFPKLFKIALRQYDFRIVIIPIYQNRPNLPNFSLEQIKPATLITIKTTIHKCQKRIPQIIMYYFDMYRIITSTLTC